MQIGEGAKLMILSPVMRKKKGTHEKVIERIQKEGFTRVRVDGEIKIIGEDEIKLEKTFKHTIEIVIDRIVIRPEQMSRISEAVELALSQSEGGLLLVVEL